MRRLFIALILGLAACQNQAPQTASLSTAESKSAAPLTEEVPSPIKAFEMYCYRTDAKYDIVVSMANSMKLKPIPKQLEPLVKPLVGSAKGFVVHIEKRKGEAGKGIFLGVSDRNTCSIAAIGYDAGAIASTAKSTYKLFSIMRDERGLQVDEAFIPGGTSKRVSEAQENGVIGISLAKPGSGSGDVVTLSFTPPETAKQVFR